MKLLIALSALVALTSTNKISYEGYKVFRFTPINEDQRAILLDMEKNNPGVIFWKGVRAVGFSVDICIPPHLQGDMVAGLSRSGMSVTEFIPNLQTLIDEEAASMQAPGSKLDWDSYPSCDMIYEFMNDKVQQYPSLVSVENIGQSYEGRALKVMKISAGDGKPIIWIDANIHAREWITNAVCTFFIEHLLTDSTMFEMRDKYEFRIMPMMNPDGYEYSRTTNRMWRKTRSPNAGSNCYGTDPNRNWAFMWMQGGASNNPCSETYGGSEAFSEFETAFVSKYIEECADRLVFYLSLHSYFQLILLPFGHENNKYPGYEKDMEIAQKAVDAHQMKFGTKFTPGNIVDLLYVASGGSMDWVKGTHNTTILAYTYELRDTGNYGFLLPPSQIIPSGEEFCDGFKVMISELDKMMAKDENEEIFTIREQEHERPEIV